MNYRPIEYDQVAAALEPHLRDLPGKLVAIDGRDGVGKTPLGRFLAWTFNVSLIETDLFLKRDGTLNYYYDQIDRIIAGRLSIPRPVIVEGVTILRTLALLKRKPDFLIYVTNSTRSGGESLLGDLKAYEAKYNPVSAASFAIQLQE